MVLATPTRRQFIARRERTIGPSMGRLLETVGRLELAVMHEPPAVFDLGAKSVGGEYLDGVGLCRSLLPDVGPWIRKFPGILGPRSHFQKSPSVKACGLALYSC